MAVRRVKRLMLFSVVAACLLLFLQWRSVSDLESLNPNKQGLDSFVWDVGENDDSLVLDREFEWEFDVNEILKEVDKDEAVHKKDWETVFNIKARRQVEKKKSSFHNNDPGNNWSREEEDNRHDYEKRRLKGLQHENQTTNVTTTQENEVLDSRNSVPTNSKEIIRMNQRTTPVSHVKQISPSWKTFNWTSEMLGALNVHVWQAWCGSTIHDLRRNKFFPLYPDVRLTIKKFVIRHWEADYGQRVFGYIHPPITGKYTFAISSDDASELWLSTDANPLNVKLIAWVGNRTSLSGAFKTKLAQFNKYRTQLSKPVFLHQGQKYFVEALHKQASLPDHLLVGWKIPGLDNFRHISGKSISLFINERKATRDVTMYAEFIPQDLPSHTHYRSSSFTLDHSVFKFGSDDLRDIAHKEMFVDENLIRNLFPNCPYNPSYLVDFHLRRYDGVKLIHDTAIYPDDNSDLSHMRQYDQCARRRLIDSYGNKVASLPSGIVSNQSLYENGSIIVFLSGKGFLPLSLAKRALERQYTEEQPQEMQLDVSDYRNVSQTPVGSTESTRKTSSRRKSYSLAKRDQEKAFEMMRKAKTKPTVGLQHEVEPKHRSNIYLIKAARDSEESVKEDAKGARSVPQHNKTTRIDRTDQKSRVDHAEVTHKGMAPMRGKRKLLSDDRESRQANQVSQQGYDSRSRARNQTSYQSSRKTNGTDSPRERSRSWEHPSKDQFKPFDDQDDLMTRMNSAREYVRKMAGIVQKYDHKLNPRALADAVYKRFGIRMKIPNIVRVPEYNDWLFHQNRSRCASDGNLLLNSEVATSVVNEYMRALNRVSNRQHSLKEIVNVEENHDVMNGDRYLVELELNVKEKNSSVRLSQFVYKKIGRTEFCLPEGFVINQHATVHIIIPVKNQGKWVQHFIDNMVELYQQTEDPHVNVILVDFSSSDINVVAALKRSPLKRYQVKKLKGPFQRAYGIHAGASLVQNPHDIIFMCDLHLQIPPNLIDSIRKHCVERKMAFAPIVARLHCGFSPLLPFGFWELQGFGLFAIYKSDYTRIGGMNYREFRTSWGGEDWELVDRVLLYKMEVERLRIPKFYHFYHSKKGMWGSRNTIFTSRSDRVFGRYDDVDEIITLYNEGKHKSRDLRTPTTSARS